MLHHIKNKDKLSIKSAGDRKKIEIKQEGDGERQKGRKGPNSSIPLHLQVHR